MFINFYQGKEFGQRIGSSTTSACDWFANSCCCNCFLEIGWFPIWHENHIQNLTTTKMSISTWNLKCWNPTYRIHRSLHNLLKPPFSKVLCFKRTLEIRTTKNTPWKGPQHLKLGLQFMAVGRLLVPRSPLRYGCFPKISTPKWMVYNGKPYENGWYGGTTIFGNTHIDKHRKNP